jgi:(1->4)-alpha-D-glucan 1-alpha-D-glucosylmutase
MAKGVEDCALYRDPRSLGLNDVGCTPEGPPAGVGPAALHALDLAASADAEWSMIASATHDTKRGEDARCRLLVLTELVAEWQVVLPRLHEHGRRHKTRVGDVDVPDRRTEVFLYQALLGSWPVGTASADADFQGRLEQYAVKAAREERLHTSWLEPDQQYEEALTRWCRGVASSPEFLGDFLPLLERVAFHGAMNSLALLAFKAASPGVPDVYQGTELWDLSFVDPDNRRAVDFARRRALLVEMAALRTDAGAAPACTELLRGWRDGRIKLFTLLAALELRREKELVLRAGSYQPLALCGCERACAFARGVDRDWVVCAAALRTAAVSTPAAPPVGRAAWRDAAFVLPQGAPRWWRDVISRRRVQAVDGVVPLAAAFACLPVVLLVADEGGY